MSAALDLRSVVERFVAKAAQPALLDPGEEPFPLIPDQWSITEWNGRLTLQAWDERRNLVRRIVSIKEQRRDRLSLITERFPKTPGALQIADLAAPLGQELERRASRTAFRDRFRLMLAREHPDCRIEEVSSEMNLEQSLSPSFVRAFLSVSQGSGGIAAMAAPPRGNTADMVTFGLIWLDYLRRREKDRAIRRLLLYSPVEGHREAAARAGLLDPSRVHCELSVYDDQDRVAAIDFGDAGNLQSTLPPRYGEGFPNTQAPAFDLPGVERVQLSDGAISLRVRGLEFARWVAGKLSSGVGKRRRSSLEAVASLAAEVARVRSSSAEDLQHPLYMQFPEGWLESQVRANPQAIDASLLPAPLYGQVPIFGAPDRAIVDLLGIDHTGRLVILELKASADLQLPLQAIDYWLRVRKHLLAGDFERLGYFTGRTIRREPPRILLVAPSLEFHSTSQAVIGFLSPAIDIVRVGLAAGWRHDLHVMFRLPGATGGGSPA